MRRSIMSSILCLPLLLVVSYAAQNVDLKGVGQPLLPLLPPNNTPARSEFETPTPVVPALGSGSERGNVTLEQAAVSNVLQNAAEMSGLAISTTPGFAGVLQFVGNTFLTVGGSGPGKIHDADAGAACGISTIDSCRRQKRAM